MHNLYNTPWSQFPERLKVASTEEIESFLRDAHETPSGSPDWVALAQAELDRR